MQQAARMECLANGMPFLNNMIEVSFFSPYSWFSSFVYISFVLSDVKGCVACK